MQVKMSEYYQGNGVSAVLVSSGVTVNVLAPDEVYEVDNAMGQWLLDNHKAVEVKGKTIQAKAHYESQAEPELKNDEAIYNSLPDFDDTEKISEPVMTSRKHKRGRE